jgi:hypothetical protein
MANIRDGRCKLTWTMDSYLISDDSQSILGHEPRFERQIRRRSLTFALARIQEGDHKDDRNRLKRWSQHKSGLCDIASPVTAMSILRKPGYATEL